jgi:hypothetical protein
MMTYYKESGGPFDFITKVPKNTILIEYSGPDDVCYFMNVKGALEKILGNREDLLSWLYGIALPGKYSPGEASRIAKCLDGCHIYLPGSDICNRVLTLVGGIQRNSSDKVKGSARLGVESNMGFFQYEYNNPAPTEILTDVTKRLIGGSYGFLNDRGKGVRQIAVETYDSIFQKFPDFCSYRFWINCPASEEDYPEEKSELYPLDESYHKENQKSQYYSKAE